ncbi:substrate-binding domain-containing protein [Paenibacillus abyssi]|nr:substrate-binding domain-containing protein [Paenibacillus abyssi]
MKKWKTVVLAALLMVQLTACGSSGIGRDPADSAVRHEEGMADKKVLLGVTYSKLQNEYIAALQHAIRAKAQEINVELAEADGQGRADNQITQVERFIADGVDAIIVNPTDRKGVAPAIDFAVDAGIPIIVLTAEVSNLDKATAYVGSNDVIAGRMETEFIVNALGGNGAVVIIHGPNGDSAQMNRTEGIKQVLSQTPDIKIIAEQTANFSLMQAFSLMEGWLQTYPRIDAVIAQNDEMALGAYKAIEAANRQDDVVVVGVDAIPDALKSIEEGKLAATVFQDAQGQGSLAVEIAVRAANSEPVNHMNIVPFELVTQENIFEYQP